MTTNEPIIPKLPDYFRPDSGDSYPPDLIGATILAIGTVEREQTNRVSGGGLAMDYVPQNSTEHRRLIFGFNELGMWVEEPKSAIQADAQG